ncbi:hypothetical protein AV530_016726 [Patagioenas fasciata monilis]|uniref:Uncharacterized protein n=1 Tax=Patagioenas fasciata monilis TaxID=372326 RepID=A0A1V4J3I7_PATFA|nr:hypothetical protein AV530_016726 [Patagioenas fasciata monilis]
MKVVLHMGFFLLVQQNPKTEKQDCLTERTMLREDTARENNLTFNSVDSVQPLLEERGKLIYSTEGELSWRGTTMQEKALHEQDATVCESYLPLGNTHGAEMLEEAPSLLAGPAISMPPSSACKLHGRVRFRNT